MLYDVNDNFIPAGSAGSEDKDSWTYVNAHPEEFRSKYPEDVGWDYVNAHPKEFLPKQYPTSYSRGSNWGFHDNVYRGYSSVEYPDPIRWDIGPNNQKLPVYRMLKDDGSPVTPIPLPDLPNNFTLPIFRKDKRNPRDPLPPNDPIGPSSPPIDWSKVPGGGINFTQPIFRNM